MNIGEFLTNNCERCKRGFRRNKACQVADNLLISYFGDRVVSETDKTFIGDELFCDKFEESEVE